MDNDPKTRQEKKGSKKGPSDSIYSSRRVRQMESMMEKKGIQPSSTTKMPTKPETPPSKSQRPQRK